MNQPEATLADPPADPPANELVDENADDEPPITGRQRGARNYTLGELTLLNSCMAATVPIGPDGVSDAVNLYNCIAKERGWAKRREKPLRQKWEKVSKTCAPGFAGGSLL